MYWKGEHMNTQTYVCTAAIPYAAARKKENTRRSHGLSTDRRTPMKKTKIIITDADEPRCVPYICVLLCASCAEAFSVSPPRDNKFRYVARPETEQPTRAITHTFCKKVHRGKEHKIFLGDALPKRCSATKEHLVDDFMRDEMKATWRDIPTIERAFWEQLSYKEKEELPSNNEAIGRLS